MNDQDRTIEQLTEELQTARRVIAELQQSASDRKKVEEELARHKDQMEELVREHSERHNQTHELLKQEKEDRNQAEKALQESQQMLRMVLDTIPVRVFWKDLDLNYLGCNRQFARDAGLSSTEEVIGKNDFQMYWSPYAEQYRATDHEVIESGIPKLNYIHLELKPHGKMVWQCTSKIPLLDIQGKPKGILGIYEDITESKQAQEALKESEERYRRITSAITDYIFTVHVSDGNALHTVHTPACKSVTGYTAEEFNRDPFLWFNMVVEEDQEKVREHATRILKGENVDPLEHRIRRKDGNIRWVSNTPVLHRDALGKLISYDGVIRDITERKAAEEEKKRLETQLLQAQKMEALGTLAGGIAHDFNNILAAIVAYAERGISNVERPEKAGKNLADLIKVCGRARDLVKQILVYGRPTKKEYVRIDLDAAIRESLRMLRVILPSSIKIRQISLANGSVLADTTQIHQVMMNLCSNASHAMGEVGGVLEVAMERVVIGEASDSAIDLAPGSYLKLSVSDTGKGMKPEVLERMFDPYFTTKEKGQGTGLGLSVVLGIVKSHGGVITCSSVPGMGTTFDIYFPEIEPLEEAASETPEEQALPIGTERILLVDDEEILARVAKERLEYLGYRVTAKTDSLEALELFRQAPDSFDLVVSDIVMPNLTGDRLAQELLNIRRDIPIILCTGYSEHLTEERAKELGVCGFIMKPFEISHFARIVRKVLSRN
jgi:PAS domain S-box-containing protein